MAYIEGTSGNDTLEGAAGTDNIFGLPGDDLLKGFGGDDRLYGNAGLDTLRGGDGADLLSGDGGRDVLDGGSGADTFLFFQSYDNDRDFCGDFTAGEDRILVVIHGGNFMDNAVPLDAEAFVIGTAPTDADDRAMYDPNTGDVRWDGDGTGAMFDSQLIARVPLGTDLTHLDVWVF